MREETVRLLASKIMCDLSHLSRKRNFYKTSCLYFVIFLPGRTEAPQTRVNNYIGMNI